MARVSIVSSEWIPFVNIMSLRNVEEEKMRECMEKDLTDMGCTNREGREEKAKTKLESWRVKN